MKSRKARRIAIVKRLRLFPDGVLLLCVISLIAVFLNGLFVVQSNAQWGSLVLLVSAVLTIGLIAIFFFNLSIRINITFLLISSFITMVGLEFFLTYYDLTRQGVPQHIAGEHSEKVKEVAARTGVLLDSRTQIDVMHDLQADGRESYPEGLHTVIAKDKQLFGTSEVLPLSNNSLADIVPCNEAGPWVTFKSDRYGFNNDDDIYDKDGLRTVTIGDSYAHGVCAEQEDNVAGQLGRRGYRTVNLGLTGTSTLRQLGILREYGSPLSPEVVL